MHSLLFALFCESCLLAEVLPHPCHCSCSVPPEWIPVPALQVIGYFKVLYNLIHLWKLKMCQGLCVLTVPVPDCLV